jgi:hypothetical protein
MEDAQKKLLDNRYDTVHLLNFPILVRIRLPIEELAIIKEQDLAQAYVGVLVISEAGLKPTGTVGVPVKYKATAGSFGELRGSEHPAPNLMF